MRRFIIEKSEADLISHAGLGLGLIGMALNKRTHMDADAKAVAPVRSDAMPHADILKSHLGLVAYGWM